MNLCPKVAGIFVHFPENVPLPCCFLLFEKILVKFQSRQLSFGENKNEMVETASEVQTGNTCIFNILPVFLTGPNL